MINQYQVENFLKVNTTAAVSWFFVVGTASAREILPWSSYSMRAAFCLTTIREPPDLTKSYQPTCRSIGSSGQIGAGLCPSGCVSKSSPVIVGCRWSMDDELDQG